MRILLVGHTRIGDAVLSSGLLDRLSGLHPDASFCLVCGPAAAPLFGGAPRTSVLPLSKQRLGRHWLQVWHQVVARRWNMVVDLRHSVLPWAISARCRHIVPRALPGEHKVIHMARTMGWAADPPAPRIWTAPQADEAAERLIPHGAPVLGLGPTANWPGKVWPADRFVKLAERVTGMDGALSSGRIAVFGGGGERHAAEPVLSALPEGKVIDLVGRVDLPTAFACLQRCSLYVGNDSGLMHMAAAAGIPTLGLFGPSRNEIYAPWGPRCVFVRTVESFDELVKQPGYDHRTTGSLMGSLEVATVADAAETLWQRSYGEVA